MGTGVSYLQTISENLQALRYFTSDFDFLLPLSSWSMLAILSYCHYKCYNCSLEIRHRKMLYFILIILILCLSDSLTTCVVVVVVVVVVVLLLLFLGDGGTTHFKEQIIALLLQLISIHLFNQLVGMVSM